MPEQIGILDLAVIASYLLVIVLVGCYAGLKKRRETGANRYFLAAHSLRWPAIGMALFATNISCLHLVSLAQAGYDSGLLMGNFEWMAGFMLVLLSLFFVPFYIRSKVATLPDFLEKRYCRECRDWLAMISILAAVVLHIAFPLSSGWIVLHGVFGIEKWTCICMICGLTALYTVLGGLAAVVMTESIQAVVLIFGAVIITTFAYEKVGGWDQMVHSLQGMHETFRLSVLRSPSVEKDFSWYAILLGYPVLGVWYWCADQTIVQRVLGARDENHARIGPLFCAVIKILPMFIFILPGLMFYVILKNGMLDGVTVENSKEVYGLMIKSLLPSGLFGVMAAALMAALMGNLASAANSISTLFSYDLWKRMRPDTPEHRLVIIGRIATFMSFVIGIALVPLLDLYGSIFAAINDVIAHMAPPITSVFVLGVFWGKASSRSAKYTMWFGSALGAGLFAAKTLHLWQPERFGWMPAFFWQTPFMIMAFYMFCLCVAMQVALSYLLPKRAHEDPQNLYWKRPLDALKSTGWTGLGDYRVLAGLVTLVMLGLYVWFR
ncbi:MAG: sodium:solute symporter family transporter [Thermoguttaceae bacterium]